jgi:hypothetical protein
MMRMVHGKRSRFLLWLSLCKEVKASQPVFVSSWQLRNEEMVKRCG